MSIRVIHPGVLTTVQDTGRYGFQRYGVSVSGGMDSFAHRLANILVGNNENEAVLEFTLKGPTIEFQSDMLISICGADISPSLNKKAIPLWRPVFARAGNLLEFGKCKFGCRAYLAFAGGLDIPLVMGSTSTYLKAGIGGLGGRQLKKGDVLQFNVPGELSEKMISTLSKLIVSKWGISNSLLSCYQGIQTIRFVPGKEFHLFSEESQKHLVNSVFTISPQSDRMGYRLKGVSLVLEKKVEMISEPVTNGTMQVSPDGNPIILLADSQTIGGYPKIAQIAQVDLPKIAQLKPGELIKFQAISLNEAQNLFLHREREILILKKQIHFMFGCKERRN